MGYCIEQQAGRFRMRADQFPLALGALKALAARAPHQRFGHFSWVDTGTLMRAQTVVEFLKEWRWHPTLDVQGNIVDLSFEGEKLGDDKQLLDALAPFVEVGSFLQMLGEDGEGWRWVFDGSRCIEQQAQVSFGDLPSAQDIVDVSAREVHTPRALPR